MCSRAFLRCVPVALYLAEKEGFEPSRHFSCLHDFQSCALDQLRDFSAPLNGNIIPNVSGKINPITKTFPEPRSGEGLIFPVAGF